MNNDSEKTDNTMNNDPGKNNKWKQVGILIIQIFLYPVHLAIRFIAWFLLLLAILVAVLIPPLILTSIILVWTADINTIITVFITVCLIPFLLRRYVKDIEESISNIKEKIAKVLRYRGLPGLAIGQSLSVSGWCYFKRIPASMVEPFTESLKLTAYPLHWAYRLVVRLLLLLIRSIISILILILLAIITIASKVFESAISKVSELAISKVSEPKAFESLLDILSLLLYRLDIIISTIFIVLIAIVLVPHLFKRQDIWKSLSKTKRRLCKVLRGRWWPGLDIKESLSVTWQNYGAKICPSLQKICAEFNKLIFATAILFIGLVIYAAIVNTPPEKGQSSTYSQSSTYGQYLSISNPTIHIPISKKR